MPHVFPPGARASARRLLARAFAGAALAIAATGTPRVAAAGWGGAPGVNAPAPVSAPATARLVDDTLAGRSGKLRARWLLPSASGLFTYLRRLLGDSVASTPGVYAAPADGRAPRPFTYIAMLPFAQKVDGRIGDYRMGFWPSELGRVLRGGGEPGDKYGPPAGFIRVTRDNAETAVSEHFRLADFLTHDQARVWPKYLALDAALVDKLELVLDDLRAHGYHAERLHVMSGFRTPRYNRAGGDPRGRAELSRHQYGDAADVAIDADGDGRFTALDAQWAGLTVEVIERRHPDLVGGLGMYTSVASPYVHIDVRGRRARWWKR